MQKLTKIIIAVILTIVPLFTFAVATNVDRVGGNRIEPLIKSDYSKFPYYVATSTTATSTFPQLKYTTMETTGAIGSTAGTMYVTGNGALGVASYPYSHFYDATGPVGIGSNTGLGLCAVTKDCSFSGFTGLFNVGIGAYAASGITTGSANFGLGYNSIGVLTTGLRNIGIGAQAMINLQSGSDNIGIGSSDTVGFSNERVLQSITTGNKNIGIGTGALNAAQGDNNVGVGYYAGLGLSSGNGNTIIGWKANVSNTISSSTAIGAEALVSCSNCISIGTSNTNVGIGTTSPYSKLSVVGTTTSAVFVATTTATSTSKGGWNISGGCFAISGTCITGGGSGTNYWTNSGATTTLNTGSVASAGTFNATSTTATSTFSGAFKVGTSTTPARGVFDVNSSIEYTVATPTGASASIAYGSGNYTANGESYQYRVYAFKTIGATTIYSSSYSATSIETANISGDPMVVNVSWTPVTGATGYRVFVYSEYYGAGFDYYYNTVSTSFAEGDGAEDSFVYGVDEATSAIPTSLSTGPNFYIDSTTGYATSTNGATFAENNILISTKASFPAGSVIAGSGVDGPGISFADYPLDGIASRGDNLGFWQNGTLALNMTDTLNEYRIPSDWYYAWAATTNNNSASDTRLIRVSANKIGVGASSGGTLIAATVGIGTTTPGTTLSLGNTGANTINISPTATSTFGSGLNLRTGCFAVNNVCIGGSSYGDSNVNAYIHASTTIPKTYTANTFSALQTIPYASTTMITSTTASSTNFISGWGNATNPGITFTGDTDTGFFNNVASGGNNLRVTSAGNQVFNFNNSFNTSYRDIFGETSKTFKLESAAGSATTPTYSFDSDGNTGMWSSGADTLNFTTNGTDQMTISSTGTTTFVGDVVHQKPTKLAQYTVATLPGCVAGYQGAIAYVTDALTPAFLTAVVGGGAVVTPVFCNGTAWVAN